MDEKEFAAAAAAHCAEQAQILGEAVQRLTAKAEKYEQLAAQVRSDVDIAQAAADAAAGERDDWQAKAQGTDAAAPAETTEAYAEVAEVHGEADL